MEQPNPSAERFRPVTAVAIVANSTTPYREHLHRRIVREMPEIRLWSIFTHEQSNANWSFDPPAEINPVSFGKGESSNNQASLKFALHEWRKAGEIIRWIQREQVRAIVMLGYNDLGRLRIIRWCARRGVPCFLWGDSNIKGDLATGFRALVKNAVVSYVVKLCTGILPCGSLGRAYFLKYGANPGRIYYFPVEPDYDLVQNLAPGEISAALTRFGLQPERQRIVFSGRLANIKRPELLLEAFAEIAASRPDWDLVFIGDGPLREQLKRTVPEALVGRVCFTGFLDDQRIVGALYRGSRVLVLPSDYEPWALVINEAAAAGMAIIATEVVGAAAELVRDGVNGRLVPPGDPAALRQALLDATEFGRIDSMCQASRPILDEWRHRGDPVAGLRKALEDCDLLPAVLRNELNR